jgi:hypothetical protein
VLSGVFRAEEVDGVANKKSSEVTTIVDIQTLLGVFLSMPCNLPLSLKKLSSVKSKTSLLSSNARLLKFFNHNPSD